METRNLGEDIGWLGGGEERPIVTLWGSAWGVHSPARQNSKNWYRGINPDLWEWDKLAPSFLVTGPAWRLHPPHPSHLYTRCTSVTHPSSLPGISFSIQTNKLTAKGKEANTGKCSSEVIWVITTLIWKRRRKKNNFKTIIATYHQTIRHSKPLDWNKWNTSLPILDISYIKPCKQW